MTTRTFMDLALDEAHAAAEAGEVPIGCVIACDGDLIAQAQTPTLKWAGVAMHPPPGGFLPAVPSAELAMQAALQAGGVSRLRFQQHLLIPVVTEQVGPRRNHSGNRNREQGVARLAARTRDHRFPQMDEPCRRPPYRFRAQSRRTQAISGSFPSVVVSVSATLRLISLKGISALGYRARRFLRTIW